MDGIIDIKVNGYSMSKDSSIAGTQYESNSTKLRISFSENWDGYAKIITFWNALGENPVDIQLGTNLLEDILVSKSVYIVPIPAEAMTESGAFDFVIQGTDNGVVKRTVGDKLRVLPSPKADRSGEPVDPTPTQAEQIRAEMDAIISDVEDARASAVEAGEAVDEIRNMSVTCETLGVGENPTVEKSIEDDKVNLHFGIPTSEEGIHVGASAPAEPHIKVWIDTSGDGGGKYVTAEEIDEITRHYDEIVQVCSADINILYAEVSERVTENDVYGIIPQSHDFITLQNDVSHLHDVSDAMSTDIEGILQRMNEEAHFRGYVSTNAKIQAMEGTPNDFAYSAESGTKWVYDERYGWQDTGSPVPDQLTPASDATPLMSGVATAGTATEYARGDHRHPTDTTRVGFDEFNTLRSEIAAVLDRIIEIQNELIGG
jgi:hypothetical protein